jgi:hypothetical protein
MLQKRLFGTDLATMSRLIRPRLSISGGPRGNGPCSLPFADPAPFAPRMRGAKGAGCQMRPAVYIAAMRAARRRASGVVGSGAGCAGRPWSRGSHQSHSSAPI